jgi:hypothetical protein
MNSRNMPNAISVARMAIPNTKTCRNNTLHVDDDDVSDDDDDDAWDCDEYEYDEGDADAGPQRNMVST